MASGSSRIGSGRVASTSRQRSRRLAFADASGTQVTTLNLLFFDISILCLHSNILILYRSGPPIKPLRGQANTSGKRIIQQDSRKNSINQRSSTAGRKQTDSKNTRQGTKGHNIGNKNNAGNNFFFLLSTYCKEFSSKI